MAVEFLPRLSQAEENITAALMQQTTIDFAETPLHDAVEYWKHLHRIEIQLDVKALEDVSISSDTPITRHLKNVSLDSALRLVLESMDLTYFIHHEVLLITTREKADSQLCTRAYPVGDLVGEGDYDSLIDAITNIVVPQTWDEVGGPGSIAEVRTAKSLVISQTQDVHQQVLRLLRALRAAKKLDPHPEMPHHSPPGQLQAPPPKSSSGQGMF